MGPINDGLWTQVTETLTVLLLAAIARGIFKGAKAIRLTFKRYGERLTDLEDWNEQTLPGWKDRLTRRRVPEEDD